MFLLIERLCQFITIISITLYNHQSNFFLIRNKTFCKLIFRDYVVEFIPWISRWEPGFQYTCHTCSLWLFSERNWKISWFDLLVLFSIQTILFSSSFGGQGFLFWECFWTFFLSGLLNFHPHFASTYKVSRDKVITCHILWKINSKLWNFLFYF